MRFEDRFTENAKSVLNKAQENAEEMGHVYVGTEHILLALAQESDSAASRVLRDSGLDTQMISELIERRFGKGARGEIPPQGLTPRAKRVIELAVAEANRLGHSYVGTEHMLMGILREYDCSAARLISMSGVDINKLYTEILGIFGNPDSSRSKHPVAAAKQTKRAETKTLDQFGRDLTAMAEKGALDPVIGRENEIKRVIQILSRRTKNNPVLIGEPGVGKTAIA